MNIPEPEDLRRIERAALRAIARRRLPAIREALAAATKSLPAPDVHDVA